VSDEAAFSVTKNFHTVRGADLAEFRDNIEALLGEGSYVRIRESFQDAFGVGISAASAAVSNVFGGSAPVTPPPSPVAFTAPSVSTVGGVAAPLPVAPQPYAAPQAAPPSAITGSAPINPKTGQPFKKYVPAGISKKTNLPYAGFWTDK
jgi:hypothetical protein